MSHEDAISYLALGDSYTIGEGVTGGERWPTQLVLRLRDQGIGVAFPRTIATTGWTCEELGAGMDVSMPPLENDYGFVSLLIGVNDQYRQYDPASYASRFTVLLERAIHLAQGRADRVLVLSIPDWGVTPFAKTLEPPRDLTQVAHELDFYNATASQICETYGVAFVDCSDISRQLCAETDNLATDQLHPGAVVYKAWAERATPVAVSLLSA